LPVGAGAVATTLPPAPDAERWGRPCRRRCRWPCRWPCRRRWSCRCRCRCHGWSCAADRSADSHRNAVGRAAAL